MQAQATLRPHRKDDLSLGLTAGEERDRLGGALERHRLRDMRTQLSVAVPARELLHAIGERLGLSPREVAPKYADDRRSLQKCEVQRQFGNFAGSKANDE